MHITEKQTPELVITTITNETDSLVSWKLTVDLFVESSIHHQAVLEVYTELLLAGCGKYSKMQFLDELELLGAELSVTARNGMITLSVLARTEVLKKVLTLYTGMLCEPLFLKDELVRSKQMLVNQLDTHKEEARERAYETLKNTLYDVTNRHYTHDPGSLQHAIKKVSRTDITAVHKLFCNAPAVLTIAGTSKNVAAVEKVQKSIAKKLTEELHTQRSEALPAISGRTLVTCHIPGKQNVEFSIGATVPLTLTSKEYPAFVFGLSVLGLWGGFTGRLMSTVREKEGLTYGIYAAHTDATATTPGHWRIMTFFTPEKSPHGVASTLREIKNIVTHGITDDEHKRFVQILNTRQQYKHESSLRRLQELHQAKVAGLTVSELEALHAQILTVTKKEVNSALATYLQPKHLVLAAAGPTHTLKKSLKQTL